MGLNSSWDKHSRVHKCQSSNSRGPMATACSRLLHAQQVPQLAFHSLQIPTVLTKHERERGERERRERERCGASWLWLCFTKAAWVTRPSRLSGCLLLAQCQEPLHLPCSFSSIITFSASAVKGSGQFWGSSWQKEWLPSPGKSFFSNLVSPSQSLSLSLSNVCSALLCLLLLLPGNSL